MSRIGSTAILRDFGKLFGGGTTAGASDQELLRQFRGHPGPETETAFATLIARHGPMVLGVCRRALPDPHDAADAFQATFLTLVRKAGSVRVDDSLGRWLYGVSRRVAARARVEAARRRAREGAESGPERPGPPPDHEIERQEALAVLDEEIARLPEPFRTTLVLCDLGGMTHEAAARRLGCPVGTVESRLSRARQRLRERLSGRGLDPALSITTGLLRPAVPETLSHATLEASAQTATLSPLIDGVISDMARTRIRTLVAGLGAALIAGGLGFAAAARQTDIEAESPSPPSQPARPAKAPVPLPPPVRVEPGDLLGIEVLEALPGRPITGDRLVRPDGTISLGFYGDLEVAGLNRHEIKVKLIEHLRKFLSDDVLGLVETNPETAKRGIAPADSDRVFVDDTRIMDAGRNAPVPALKAPARLKPGDRLVIEVLQALPGRPIAGERLVRQDGTISLGFYGDVHVAGLNRREIKERLINHLRKFIKDEFLGLLRNNPETGEPEAVAPVDSDRVFVDESINFDRKEKRNRRSEEVNQRLDQIEVKLDRLIRAVEDLKRRPN